MTVPFLVHQSWLCHAPWGNKYQSGLVAQNGDLCLSCQPRNLSLPELPPFMKFLRLILTVTLLLVQVTPGNQDLSQGAVGQRTWCIFRELWGLYSLGWENGLGQGEWPLDTSLAKGNFEFPGADFFSTISWPLWPSLWLALEKLNMMMVRWGRYMEERDLDIEYRGSGSFSKNIPCENLNFDQLPLWKWFLNFWLFEDSDSTLSANLNLSGLL